MVTLLQSLCFAMALAVELADSLSASLSVKPSAYFTALTFPINVHLMHCLHFRVATGQDCLCQILSPLLKQ
jgi:hypothetical protein